jgi:hypothetical protein
LAASPGPTHPTSQEGTVHADAIERLDEIRKKVQELRGYL